MSGDFAILRAKRVKNINSTFSHNLRAALEHCQHVDTDKSGLNEVHFDKLGFQNAGGNYEALIDKYISDNNIFIKKGTNVKVMEFLLTASPEFFEKASKEELKKWKDEQLKFAKAKWGDSILIACTHLDEKSPHLQVLVLADKKKVHKYKNQKGEFFKEKHTISPGDFNPQYLRSLQDEYAQVNKKFGLQRGLRNSRATHRTLKQFYKDVSLASSKDYDRLARKVITKVLTDKQNILGYIKTSEIPQLLAPVLNKIFTSNKKMKAMLNYNKDVNVKELEEILKNKQSIEKEKKQLEELRGDYMNSIKNHNALKKENEELKTSLQKYEQKPNVQAYNSSSFNLDKKTKIR